MPREEMLDELSEGFPDKELYNFDEQVRYDIDRALLLDRVLEGSFESYERVESVANFSYKITGDAKFTLEVFYDDYSWKRSYDYIVDAFEIGEAAYRLLVAFPRVQEAGAILREQEMITNVDPEFYEEHDHMLEEGGKKAVELIHPPHKRIRGFYVMAIVYLCNDGNYLLTVTHSEDRKTSFPILDVFYSDPDLAVLIARGYIKHVDTATFPHPDEAYRRVYMRVMN